MSARFASAIGLGLALASGAAFAQHGDDPSGLHVDPAHTRHTHQHNPDHATDDDPARFHTTRTSRVDLPLPNEEDAFFFVIFGDRTGGPDEGISVLKDAVRDTNLLEPDFVITVGDLIDGYNQTPEWMEQMREYKGVMNELICPWFPVAGNHDVYWRGDGRPTGEHEQNYEMHFGPLWYAFEHKNSWFIVLYTDEGNPETGEKNFRKPESQRMSPEQFSWLQDMLGKAEDVDHVFLFVHHPRWLGGGYGSDWDRVHELLVEAGNVAAVFAGHIHRMRYDPKDGIEYVTLATVGGVQRHTVPEAGWLHHFNTVTVRQDQVAMGGIPVGQMLDVREITGALADEAARLAEASPDVYPTIELDRDGSASGVIRVSLENTSSRDVDATVVPDSGDSRWTWSPDHDHGLVPAGASREFLFRVNRQGDPLDSSFRPLDVVVHQDMLAPSRRYAIPDVRVEVPLLLDLVAPARPAVEHALVVDGGHARVPSAALELPDGPMTIECWMRGDELSGRTGLVTKTENSDYGIFVSDGQPSFSIFLGNAYATASRDQRVLQPGRWHHVAGVYDGNEVRLYVDGELLASKMANGARRTNRLPLIIGGDVGRRGEANSLFQGQIDGVRISSVARYEGAFFTPERRLASDDQTVLLLNMDGAIGKWLFDESTARATPTMTGAARVAPADE